MPMEGMQDLRRMSKIAMGADAKCRTPRVVSSGHAWSQDRRDSTSAPPEEKDWERQGGQQMAKERLLLVMLDQEFLKRNSSFVKVMCEVFIFFWYHKRECQWLKDVKGLNCALKSISPRAHGISISILKTEGGRNEEHDGGREREREAKSTD